MSAPDKCPICGDHAMGIGKGAGRYAIACTDADCQTAGPTRHGLEAAIAAWNRRAGDDEMEKLRAEVAGLETALLAIPGHTELPAHVWETIVLIRERRAALGGTT